MESRGKRVSAFAVFKAKRDATPRKASSSRGTASEGSVRKPHASTPIAGILRQGQGQLRKLRNSARAKKVRKNVKQSPESVKSRERLQSMDVDGDEATSSGISSMRSSHQGLADVRGKDSLQKKRKSPYVTTPDKSRRKMSTRQHQQTEPSAKRLKFHEEEEASKESAPSTSQVADKSLTRDSLQHGRDVFAWLISPVKVDDFFKNLFERKPLFLKRHNPGYFREIFTSEELHNILRDNDLQFTRNLDVTTYADGKRETHNPVGRAHPQVVWDYYKNGCSVRLLNPQSYSTRVWQLLAALQEFFGCFVGANIYMTPPGSQGFAPHYDDIEAFVLQLEGKKHWKLYNQRSSAEVLPRFSSANFTDADIGTPILDTTLEAGDLLYFPRGVIHQANTPSETHSLHITVSACQKHSWGDLMEMLLGQALDTAREEDVEFRKSLPTEYLNYMGVAHADLDDSRRTSFKKKIGDLFSRLLKHAPIDAAVDQMSTEFMHTSLPPVLENAEESCSIYGTDTSCKNGSISGFAQLQEDTPIRLLRRNILRLIPRDEKVLVYHSVENSRVFKEKEPQYFEIPAEAAPAVEHLLHSYPDYIPVSNLPLMPSDTDDVDTDQVDLAQLLFEKGLVVTKYKLKPSSSSSLGSREDVAIHQSL
ncbi:ribosomal oxygenase 1-like [Diadema antillarum]|uniref:ribosomal oxygenase 1-like n=2 Tax=Diadema antillarum TaxID=105358 RepID=UPI003A892A5D